MKKPSKFDREKRDAEWNAENERVRRLGDLFSSIPRSPQIEALKTEMIARIVFLYDEGKFEQGDAILEFLPNDDAKKLLDSYFAEAAE